MCVLFERLAHRVGEIGHQGEVQVGIAVGEISDFEVPDQLMHLLLAEEQRWNGDDGCAGGRNALAEVEFGQGVGVEEGGDSVVDQLDCNLHGRKQQNDDGKCKRYEVQSLRKNRKEHNGKQEESEEIYGGDVEVLAAVKHKLTEPPGYGRMKANTEGELREAFVDEVVADVDESALHTRVVRWVLTGLTGKIEGRLRHLSLGAIGAACDRRDTFAVELAAVEVHALVCIGGILEEQSIESDERLNEKDPVDISDIAEAPEANGEHGEGNRLRSTAQITGFVEQRLEQGKFQKGRDIPQLIKGERFVHLQCMDKSLEGRCREFSVDGAKIGGGCGGDARFILQSRQNHARKAGYLARPVGHGSDRRTQKAEVCAKFMQRGPARGEARIFCCLLYTSDAADHLL